MSSIKFLLKNIGLLTISQFSSKILSFLFGVIEIRGIFAAFNIILGRRLSAHSRHFFMLVRLRCVIIIAVTVVTPFGE